ncbi:hypothetical protein K523DRAFT_95767 [Schizophyllum commune Tattone D]|nr:hypothetical protein K523DRAFT_95767 [Schizophyllum commune Tattone D]
MVQWERPGSIGPATSVCSSPEARSPSPLTLLHDRPLGAARSSCIPPGYSAPLADTSGTLPMPLPSTARPQAEHVQPHAQASLVLVQRDRLHFRDACETVATSSEQCGWARLAGWRGGAMGAEACRRAGYHVDEEDDHGFERSYVVPGGRSPVRGRHVAHQNSLPGVAYNETYDHRS